MAPLSAETRADLWAHARELAAAGSREVDPVPLRRALVTLAVAGSGGDRDAYTTETSAVCDAAVRIGLDPSPLFAAAAALVAEDDPLAREILITEGAKPPHERPGFGLRIQGLG